MYPDLFSIGKVTIHTYGVFMVLGFSAGLYSMVRLGRKEGRDYNFCSDLLMVVAISGILGARIGHVLSNFGDFMRHPLEIIQIYKGGLIYYGGFIAAAIALCVFARIRKQKILSLLDFVVTSLPLAHVFGRLGCTMNGCCFGKMNKGVMSIDYPATSTVYDFFLQKSEIMIADIGKAVSLYPVQIMEASFNLLLYFYLFKLYKKKKRNGVVTVSYLLIYPVGRFLLEFLRGDDRMMLGALTVAQVISICLIILGVGIWTISRKQTELTD